MKDWYAELVIDVYHRTTHRPMDRMMMHRRRRETPVPIPDASKAVRTMVGLRISVQY
jgi:hypothetical protein